MKSKTLKNYHKAHTWIFSAFTLGLQVPLLKNILEGGTSEKSSLILGFLGAFVGSVGYYVGRKIQKKIYDLEVNPPAVIAVIEQNIHALIEQKPDKEDINTRYVNMETPLCWAAALGNKVIIDYLLGLGADTHLTGPNGYPPAYFAILTRNKLIFEILQKKKPLSRELMNSIGMTQFMLDCYLGNFEAVCSVKKKIVLQDRDIVGMNALHYAILGAAPGVVINHICDLVDSSELQGVVEQEFDALDRAQLKQRKLVTYKCTCLYLALELSSEEIVLQLIRGHRKFKADHKGQTVLMKAAQKGYLKLTQNVLPYVNYNEVDSKKMAAIDYARSANQTQVQIILKQWEQEHRERAKAATSQSANPPSTAIPVDSLSNSGKQTASIKPLPTKLKIEDIQDELGLCLRGLVGVENFISSFAYELNLFLNSSSSRGIVIWGSSSVGKTEIAKRLCGELKNVAPSLTIPGLNFKYIPCCDQALSPRDIVNSVENGTVIFLDEVDKFLSPASGIMNDSQAKGLRTSLITNFNSKVVFWVFTGTFEDIRGKDSLTKEKLSQTLGPELTSRLDFAGWRLNDWDIESLQMAGKNSALARDKNIEYDETAFVTLLQYILKNGGGIRSLERAHESIKRMNKIDTEQSKSYLFDKAIVDQFIKAETTGEV